MIHLKHSSLQRELSKSIKRLVSDLERSTIIRNDNLSENAESIASYVSRINDESLNRSFLDYCSAAKSYAKLRNK